MEEKDYEALLGMFASAGWKYFMEGRQGLLDVIINAAPDGAIPND